jgi:hypothetical protein
MADCINLIGRDARAHNFGHIIEDACGECPRFAHARKIRRRVQRDIAVIVKIIVGVVVHARNPARLLWGLQAAHMRSMTSP